MVYENLSKALHTSPTSVLEHSHRYFNSYLNKSLASLLRYQQTRCGPAYRGDNSYTNKQANYRSQIGLRRTDDERLFQGKPKKSRCCG